jgi:hypothetical protein
MRLELTVEIRPSTVARPGWSGPRMTPTWPRPTSSSTACEWAELRFRHADANNYYAVRLGADTGGGTGPVELIQCVRGKRSVKAGDTYSTASSPFSVKIKVTGGDQADVWVEGTQEFTSESVSAVPPVAWPWRAKNPSSRL